MKKDLKENTQIDIFRKEEGRGSKRIIAEIMQKNIKK